MVVEAEHPERESLGKFVDQHGEDDEKAHCQIAARCCSADGQTVRGRMKRQTEHGRTMGIVAVAMPVVMVVADAEGFEQEQAEKAEGKGAPMSMGLISWS